MKGELYFDGEKFISSSRGASITGYNKDYIGQLCRDGKVSGKLVGRSWFVSENALLEHKNSNLNLGGKKFITSRQAVELSGYAADYIGQMCRLGKLECKMVGRAWFVAEDSLLRHVKEHLGADAAKKFERAKTRADTSRQVRTKTHSVVLPEEKQDIAPPAPQKAAMSPQPLLSVPTKMARGKVPTQTKLRIPVPSPFASEFAQKIIALSLSVLLVFGGFAAKESSEEIRLGLNTVRTAFSHYEQYESLLAAAVDTVKSRSLDPVRTLARGIYASINRGVQIGRAHV